MATVDVFNIQGDKVSQAELPDAIFAVPVSKAVLHQVVTAQLANRACRQFKGQKSFRCGRQHTQALSSKRDGSRAAR
jgi:ribosomal protein L4